MGSNLCPDSRWAERDIGMIPAARRDLAVKSRCALFLAGSENFNVRSCVPWQNHDHLML